MGAVRVPPTAGWRKFRVVVYTGGVAAVVFMGTMFGAGLKTQQDHKAARKQLTDMPIEDRIATLEARKTDLMRLKKPLDEKLGVVQQRIRLEREKALLKGQGDCK